MANDQIMRFALSKKNIEVMQSSEKNTHINLNVDGMKFHHVHIRLLLNTLLFARMAYIILHGSLIFSNKCLYCPPYESDTLSMNTFVSLA